MFELIEKLRTKPESTKKQIAFLMAFSIAGIIFVIWLSVIYPDWHDGQKKEAQVSKLEPSPLSGFSGNFANGFLSLKAQFSKLKESVGSFTSGGEHINATSTSSNSSK